jgi:predicted GTPase
MNYQGAKELVILLADSLEKMGQVLEAELGLADEAGKLRVRASQIREDRFKVVVVGEFKRGKSTLLNALLGNDLLAQRHAPCTPMITVIQYDEKPAARVRFTQSLFQKPYAACFGRCPWNRKR